MPLIHEWMYYEVMWRNEIGGRQIPQLWWTQQYFRHWTDNFDSGLFDSKEAAFARNAFYRYWNMVGVKDAQQETLVGQAGEIEPVFDKYTLLFFLFDPVTRALHLPQLPEAFASGTALQQSLERDYLPVVITRYQSPLGIVVTEKVLATTVGVDQRTLTLARFNAQLLQSQTVNAWLCLAIVPAGPSGFQRSDRQGQTIADRRINFLQYLPAEQRVLINGGWGPVFDTLPASYGTYGNGASYDPGFYVANNPFRDLVTHGTLNGAATAVDNIAGLCSAVFAWPLALSPAQPNFELAVRLPVDDYRGPNDLAALKAPTPSTLETNNRSFWTGKLDGSGLQAALPPLVEHLFRLFRTCRAHLLILADNGAIHPGPTIYDSFWIRDSSVEGVACALAGDSNLAAVQFGTHYPTVFNFGQGSVGPASLYGFFGSEHEKNDLEWDSNGEALWAFGRFDRIVPGFGNGVFSPYVLDGARWLRNNRSAYGLLYSGWSAEHLGDKDKPHYWDDFWAIAGLWEAAKLAERAGHGTEAHEIWSIYNDIAHATADSIRWVLGQQANKGHWETFIPTGPADVGRLDSTMIGTLAYFHPTRLYMGAKLGADIDFAARATVETIWSHFVDGGFRHDAAWQCYGPYLTLQLAHAFLLIGDIARMDACLSWAVNAAFATINPSVGTSTADWQIVLGAWNEQHCYPIAKRFTEFPWRWYMGDIPHGWACAEFMLLLRDILFFEADEDAHPTIYIAPGVPEHWVLDGQNIGVSDAPTIFGEVFGYALTLDTTTKTVTLTISQPVPNVSYVYPCHFGTGVVSVSANGAPQPVTGKNVALPAGTTSASIVYQ
jgi:hypothetical protein